MAQKGQTYPQGFSAKVVILMGGATILLTLVLMALSDLGSADISDSATNTARNRMTLPVIIHLATVIPAIPLGAYILWRKKGDRLHKVMGKSWAALMMITAISSFWLGHAGQGIAGTSFSYIHIFSVVTIFSIPMGIIAIRNGDVKGHYRSMQGPYIGLLIAGLFAFIPGRILGMLVFG